MSGVGVDQLLVDVCGSLESGVEQPDESCDLEHIVEGNEVKDEAGELVSHGEESEDYPVGKPLLVIIFCVL